MNLGNSIYRFEFDKPSDDQCEISIHFFVEELDRFQKQAKLLTSSTEWSKDEYESNRHDVSKFTESEIERISRTIDSLKGVHAELLPIEDGMETSTRWIDTWYPKYACATLFQHNSLTNGLNVEISLVALDEWKFNPSHTDGSSSGNRQHVFSADALCRSILECGSIPVKEIDRFKKELAELIGQSVCKDKPDKKHPKTPTFIYSHIAHLLNKSKIEARGGLTDVGMHTGSQQKETSWPLVCVSFQELLGDEFLLEKFMIHFDLYQLEQHIEDLESGRLTLKMSQKRLDAMAKILDVCSLRAFDLDRDPWYDLSAIARRCEQLGNRVRELVEQLRTEKSKECIIDFTANLVKHLSYLSIKLNNPSFSEIKVSSNNLNIREESLKEICTVEILSDRNDKLHSFSRLVQWTKMLESSKNHLNKNQETLLGLSKIERFLFKKVDVLSRTSADSHLGLDESKSLIELVEIYQKLLNNWLSQPQSASLMYTRHRSHELIVVWICCCLLHRAAVHAHPLMNEYGVPMEFTDLKYCVTDDKYAIDAISALAAYTRKWKKSDELTLFSLRSSQRHSTCTFASKYAQNDHGMRKRLESEKEYIVERQLENWKTVEEKKAQAIDLREQIRRKSEEESSLVLDKNKLSEELSDIGSQIRQLSKYYQSDSDKLNIHKLTVRQYEV